MLIVKKMQINCYIVVIYYINSIKINTLDNPQTKLMNEPELIVQLKQKDPNAWVYLYDHYAPALFGIIKRIVKIQEVSEEVLQDSFVKIWHNIQSYDAKKGRLFTWMLYVARNLAIDQLRSKEFTRKNKTDQLEDKASLTLHHKYEEPTIRDTALIDLLRHLSDKQQMVVHLIYFQGYTHAQVSKEFDIPLGTVKTRLRAALLKLRELLDRP